MTETRHPETVQRAQEPTVPQKKQASKNSPHFAVAGSEINDDNEVQQLIAEKVGAKVKETWLTGQTADEAVGTMIAGGEYPDFIEGQTGTKQLYEAGALVALDDYLDDYPNIKNLFTDLEWEKLRQEDGHIYWILSSAASRTKRRYVHIMMKHSGFRQEF